MLRILVLASGAALSSAFAPCCAYNGEGDAVLLGAGVLNAFPPVAGSKQPTGPSYAAPMAVGVSKAGNFAAVLFAAASGPEDAVAGWIITSNATNDVIFTFTNASSTPACAAGVGPLGSMAWDYALCAGSGLFPTHDHDYKLAGLAVGVFSDANADSPSSSSASRAAVPA